MIAITSKVWIQFPVFGNFGLILPPKKPSSHKTSKIMIMVHIIIFLLDWFFNYWISINHEYQQVMFSYSLKWFLSKRMPTSVFSSSVKIKNELNRLTKPFAEHQMVRKWTLKEVLIFSWLIKFSIVYPVHSRIRFFGTKFINSFIKVWFPSRHSLLTNGFIVCGVKSAQWQSRWLNPVMSPTWLGG